MEALLTLQKGSKTVISLRWEVVTSSILFFTGPFNLHYLFCQPVTNHNTYSILRFISTTPLQLIHMFNRFSTLSFLPEFLQTTNINAKSLQGLRSFPWLLWQFITSIQRKQCQTSASEAFCLIRAQVASVLPLRSRTLLLTYTENGYAQKKLCGVPAASILKIIMLSSYQSRSTACSTWQS